MAYILHFVQDRLWDDNGNLLNDGVNTYTYDHANRLISVVGSPTTSSYKYNGLGDRLQQTVDSVTESYTLDLNNWLTQVLADGTNTYLYGAGRIAQYDAGGAEYFLGDALGSVRQLSDDAGAVTLVKSYQPFGKVMKSVGTGSSPYGFTNEWTDGNGMIYLRARYYEPGLGRFITKDVWPGDFNHPLSLNSWLYAYSNPVRFSDPSGFISQADSNEANRIRAALLGFGVEIQKDWGFGYELLRDNPWFASAIPAQLLCDWFDGYWRSIHELDLVTEAIIRTTAALKGVGQFKSAMGHVQIARWGSFPDSPAFSPPDPASIIGDVVLPDYHFNQNNEYAVYSLIHEFGHVWDWNVSRRLSRGLQDEIGTITCQQPWIIPMCWFDIDAGKEDPPGNPDDLYAGKSIFEDWAESFATYIYPKYYEQKGFRLLGPLRKQYVVDQINALP